MISNKNFSGQLTPSEIDTEYSSCNFAQSGETDGLGGWLPTRIFPGDDTPRTFIECNMTNVLPPPGSTLIRCNTHLIEFNRNNADHWHGKLDPVTLTRQLKTPEAIPHTVHKQVLQVVVDGENADSARLGIVNRPDVREIL